MPGPAQQMTPEALARQFERFAMRECRDTSPLYERLAISISRDREMLELAAQATSEPVPNLFLAAVHFLLLRGARSPLSAFYPTITQPPVADADPFPAFRSFCWEHAEEIKRLIRTRRVQTNEVRRCSLLLPAFGIVGERAQGLPVTLVEIGASAGFNLLWDRYGYDYGAGRRYGDPNSAVQLTCEIRGERRPPFPDVFPPVASRLGVDLQPVDARDQTAIDWLRALIWPEHTARIELLERAVEMVRRETPEIRPGDALDLLPGIMAAIPTNTVLCLFHTFVINQFSPEGRERLAALLADYGATRDLHSISIAAIDAEYPELRLLSFENGVRTERLLAHCSGHGRWLKWLQPA